MFKRWCEWGIRFVTEFELRLPEYSSNVQTETHVERTRTEPHSKGFTDLIVHQIRSEHYRMSIFVC